MLRRQPVGASPNVSERDDRVDVPAADGYAPQRSSGRVHRHLSTPLYRNAYLLIIGGFSGSALGFVFWVLAAHEYSAEIVGRNSAAVAAMIVVSGISQLGLNAVLVRYLPIAGAASRRFVVVSYLATSAVAVVASLAAALTSAHWAPTLRFLGADDRWLAAFVVATVAWTVFSLQDSVMTGMRQAHWVPIENSLFSAAKIAFLIALAGVAPRGGVFVAWNVPVLLSLLPVNLLIFRRLIARHAERSGGKPLNPESLFRFAAGNYLGSLFALGSSTLLPVVVASESGAKTTAYFFIPWTIATALQLVALNMTTSLTVEVAFDETKLREYCRRVMVHTLRLVAPMTIVLVVGAPYLLRVFGDAYSEEGATLLRLLALATIPNLIIVLGLSVARIHHRGGMVLVVQGILCVLTLGLSYLLLPRLGIDGVGAASLISQSTVAGLLLVGILRPVLFPGESSERRTGRAIGSHGGR